MFASKSQYYGIERKKFQKDKYHRKGGKRKPFPLLFYATTSYVRLFIAKSALLSFRALASISIQAGMIDLLATDGNSGIMSTFPFQSVGVDNRRLRCSETRWGFAAGNLAG